jgi:mRNA-degrading endonuclease RelE of RelBE toxin-antitoxin system
MSTEFRIELSRRAEVALERLQPRDRRRIVFAIDRLAEAGLSSKDVSKLGAGARGEIYLIRAGRDLRIIVKKISGLLEVLDIVRHDKLRQVYDTFRHGGGA